MTHQTLVVFPREPVLIKKPFFYKIENEEKNVFRIPFNEYKTEIEGVYFLGFGHETNYKGISELEYFGLTSGMVTQEALDRNTISNLSAFYKLQAIIKNEKQIKPFEIENLESSWFLVMESHDAFLSDEFACLMLDLYSTEDIKSARIYGANLSDVTLDAFKAYKKIKNLSDKSNPLLNPDAIIAFETYPRSQRRKIAHEKMLGIRSFFKIESDDGYEIKPELDDGPGFVAPAYGDIELTPEEGQRFLNMVQTPTPSLECPFCACKDTVVVDDEHHFCNNCKCTFYDAKSPIYTNLE